MPLPDCNHRASPHDGSAATHPPNGGLRHLALFLFTTVYGPRSQSSLSPYKFISFLHTRTSVLNLRPSVRTQSERPGATARRKSAINLPLFGGSFLPNRCCNRDRRLPICISLEGHALFAARQRLMGGPA